MNKKPLATVVFVLFFGLVTLYVLFVRHRPSTPSDWAAWIQAVGSILAITAAVWVMNHQQKMETLRLERKKLDDKIAQFDGVLQLAGAVGQLAEKISKHCDGTEVQAPDAGKAGLPGKPTLRGLEILCVELEVAIEVIGGTDHLQLGQYELIAAMQVAQSSGRVTANTIRHHLLLAEDTGQMQWREVSDTAKLCAKSVKRLADPVANKGNAMAAAHAKM